MSDEHEPIRELLGAWALDACLEQEAAMVEAHLAGCAACAAEANQLRRATAGLALTAVTAPPPSLRGAVLAAALARRPAGVALAAAPGVGEATTEAAGYASWVDRFDALLGRLTPAQWRQRVVHDWDVQDLVAHLAVSDELLVAQLAPEQLPAPVEPPAAEVPLAQRTATAIARHRGRPPAETRAAWRAGADAVLRAAAGRAAPDQPVRLPNPRLPRQPLRHALAQRVFETWIHDEDLRSAFGGEPDPPRPEHVTQIAALGVTLLPAAMRLAGAEHPGRTGRLVLVGAGGGDWTVPLSPDTRPGPPDVTVTMAAVEFCRLLGNRRAPEEVVHSVEGDPALAGDLLRVAVTLGCD